MKPIHLIAGAAAMLACISSQAQTTLTAWNFDNLATGANSSPAASTGIGTATAIGLGNASNPSIVSLAGSSSGGANSWQFSATGGADGWNTGAAIGTQGAKFAASTVGYYQIQLSFDVYATVNAEAALQVQYTTEGAIWHNASIASAGSSAILATNTVTTNSLVVGTYIILTNNGTAAWNKGVTVNLTGISGVDNDANFAIRIVNASTGTNCFDTTGAHYNNANTTANWTFDNVVVQGISYDTIADWTFENMKTAKHINNPVPAISNNLATAACIGFGIPPTGLVSSTFSGGFSTNDADVTTSGAPYPSTGPSGQNVWRLRGQPGNGWLSTQPIGSQGAEFDVSTVNYTNVVITFDLYETSQGEAKMCVLYTTDGWATTKVANNLAYGANPTLIATNTTSANTVMGTYFNNTYGSIFFNNLVIDFTGDGSVADNPHFGIRIVNAAMGDDCVNYLGQPYNNNSGNARLDNVAFNGQYQGRYAPIVTNAAVATVDHPWTNTFLETITATSTNIGWHTNISAIYVNGILVTNKAYTVTATNIIFTPSTNAPVLTVAGLDNVVIYATNYTSAKLTQLVVPGVATKLSVTPVGSPSASGGTLTLNPNFTVTDQYGNGTTNPYAAMTVTATVSNSPATWVLGGSTVQPILNGSCTFTDLTATLIGTTAITNAAIHFTLSGGPIAATNSASFTIGVAPVPFTPGNLAVMQVDTLSNNTTFSIIEVDPSALGQTKPVNIIPISATGANALRMSPSGSGGHMALSDDGTFLCFAAYQDGSSATADETFNLNRAVGTLNYTNLFTLPVSYVSQSYGGSQARAACSPDNQNFIVDDKDALFVNNSRIYVQNNISVRSFGGATWALTAKVPYPPVPAMFQFANGGANPLPGNAIDWADPGDNGPVVTTGTNPPPDSVAQDFYMVATNGAFNIAYILDQSGGVGLTNTVISKWLFNPDPLVNDWENAGWWTNTDNADTLFATTNGTGGVYLYYANGSGGQSGNSLIRLTDQNVAGELNIVATNVIYTAPAGTSIEGVTFVPVETPYVAALTPPPFLTAQAGAIAGAAFSITNWPDDANWRAGITNVTVNGTALPGTAYDATQPGVIKFAPAASALLQTSGSKAIVVSAAGYGAASVVQTLGAPAMSKLGGVVISGGSLSFTFTNFPGLSFSVLATNDVTAPRSNWPVVGSAVENPVGSGHYQFTDPTPATNSPEYYLLRQP